MTDSFPQSGRLLGLDYGTKRLGLAVSNAEQTVAAPLENYSRGSEETDARHLQEIVRDYSIEGIVVGLPVLASGEEGEKAREARRFGRWVNRVTGVPVSYWDERYTTTAAEQHLLSAELTHKKRRARRDKLAAQIILQSFLERANARGKSRR